MGLLQIAEIVVFCFVLWSLNLSAKEIKFLEEPKSAEVYEGINIELKCIFSEPVAECLWKKSERTVTIGGRYAYRKGTEYNTKDCSISISNCNFANDNAIWKCGDMNGLMSRPVKLTVVPKEHAFIVGPCDVTVNLREEGRLDCVLRVSVKKCHWKRNGQKVYIDKRYQYLVGNGRNTSICSIIITDVRPIDNGTWQCAISDDDNEKFSSILSREATFSVKPVSFVSQPRNTIVKSGEQFVLDCVLSIPVPECFWKRNGTEVSIEGRYRYLTGNGRDASVCSILINDARITDNGTWQCSFKGNDTFPGGISKEAAIEVAMGKSSSLVTHDSRMNSNIVLVIMAAFIGSLLSLVCQYLYKLWFKRTKIKSDTNVPLDGEKKPLLRMASREQITESNYQLEKQLDVSLIHNSDVYRVASGGIFPELKFLWIVDNFHMKIVQAFEGNDDFISEHNYIVCSKGCRVQFRMHIETLHSCLYLDKRSISLCFKFVPEKPGSPIGDHVFEHDISFVVRDLKTRDMAISQTKQPGYGTVRQKQWKTDWTGNRIFSTLGLIETDGNYLDKDNLNVEVLIRNLRPLLDVAASHNGIFEWKIDNYSVKRKQEEEGYFEKLVSSQFYTSKRGYLMRTLLFLNGSLRHGTHIEVQLRTNRGKYDAELPRAFAHVRKVMIMPWDDYSSPITQTTIIDPSVIGEEEAEYEMGEPKKALLVPRTDVENNIYLQHDTIHIKVEIISLDAANHMSDTSEQWDDSNAVKYRSIANRKKTKAV